MVRFHCATMFCALLACNSYREAPSPAALAPPARTARDGADQLEKQATDLLRKERFREAMAPAEQALAIRERALGTAHPAIAANVSSLAEAYRGQGFYDRAVQLHLRALAIREKALGPTHLDVAASLNDLGATYYEQRDYGRAEQLTLRALEIREQLLDATHPSVGESLNNLAVIYKSQGIYEKAEPLYRRVLAIRERLLAPDSPEIANTLNNLGALYHEQGAHARAGELFRRALAIRERALGPAHPDVASSLNNLAVLYGETGTSAEAAQLYLRALDIWEKTLGPVAPVVAVNLTNLANTYRDLGQYPKAEAFAVRALDIRRKMLGPMHLDVARSLSSLAMIYQRQGAYAKAEPLLLRALGIREKALGPMHLEVARGLTDLAALYWTQGRYGNAEASLARAAEIQNHQLGAELARLPEPRKRALMAMLLRLSTNALVSFHADAAPGRASALDLALATVVSRKGRILDSLIDGDAQLRAHLTPELREQLDHLADARAELVARLYPPAGRAVDLAAVAVARARVDELESALGEASAEFRAQTEPVRVAKIQAALPADAALVEFVRYARFDPRSPQSLQEERYIAYLLTARGPARWVALGEAAAIDTEIDTTLAAISRRCSEAIANTALRRLDARVLAPIRARLHGVSHLILAPDSKLNLVPFDALVDGQGQHVVERYLVSYVSTARDLLRLTPRAPRSPATIIAGPEYGQPSRSSSTPQVSFPPLVEAAEEATDLRPYFRSEPVTGAAATKAKLAALRGPAVLHIATHGFYARDGGTPPALAGTTCMALADTAAASARVGHTAPRLASRGIEANGAPLPRSSDDPLDGLDRAGLAMAGANQSAAGIVTAREIAGFDWWGTQLVVLSACETGVGDVPSGDGVYGLRRALMLAGAASHVVSLWRVNDAATRSLMSVYYRELARGVGRAEALRQAKRELLHQHDYAHPYYWAPFIPAGDWRPLDPGVLRQPTQFTRGRLD